MEEPELELMRSLRIDDKDEVGTDESPLMLLLAGVDDCDNRLARSDGDREICAGAVAVGLVE